MPAAKREFIFKDLRLFFRDNTQWSQLILLAVLLLIYIFNIKSLPIHSGERIPFSLVIVISFLNLGLAGFVLAAVAARFIFPAISLEGRQMWLLRSSPLDPGAMLWSKYWTGTVPLLVLALVITVLTNWLLQAGVFMMAVSVGTILLYTLAASALALTFGVFYPQFGTENAAQIPTSFGGVVYMMASLSLLALVIMLEAPPVAAQLRAYRQRRRARTHAAASRHGRGRRAHPDRRHHPSPPPQRAADPEHGDHLGRRGMSAAAIAVDLFSDTVTRPTAAMRRFMCDAEVGDEQQFEDPTVNRLQDMVAELLGKEAALFLPSGTMCNQVAFAVHCRAGDEILLHETAHPLLYEAGGAAALIGAVFRPLSGPRGMFTAAQVRQAVRPAVHYMPRTRVVSIEQTANIVGGVCWPIQEIEAVCARGARGGTRPPHGRRPADERGGEQRHAGSDLRGPLRLGLARSHQGARGAGGGGAGGVARVHRGVMGLQAAARRRDAAGGDHRGGGDLRPASTMWSGWRKTTSARGASRTGWPSCPGSRWTRSGWKPTS